MFALHLTEAGTDKVAMITMAYAAPEVMSAMFGKVVTLDGSMDVWAMAIVILQAITRRTAGPTDGDVSNNGARCFA